MAVTGRVHPRSRGEYKADTLQAFFRQGSSPLTRGIRMECLLFIVGLRFIPAHAGNTSLGLRHFLSAKVHPRSRGEYRKSLNLKDRFLGSSPLTRGIPVRLERKQSVRRFIPAHAGNTSSPSGRRLSGQVHPRSRGEYSTKKRTRHLRKGSPPLTRGIH